MSAKNPNDYKIDLGALDGEKMQYRHFCYVPRDKIERFQTLCNPHNLSLTHWAREWAAKEFQLYIETMNDIEDLKTRIHDKYSGRYPDLPETTVAYDRYGFRRMWILENMKETENERY